MSNAQGLGNQAANVSECRITLPSGRSEDLRDKLIEISYFEDIYSFSVSGYIMIRDGIGLIDLLKLRGEEVITLHFDKYSGTENSVLPPKYLVAYTVSDRRHVTQDSQMYKIHFCSLDLLKNQQTIVSKSYKGKSIDYIVDDVLNTELKTATPISGIQPTMASYDYVPPSIRPFEVISDVSNLARPTNNLKAADMFLFENRFGYVFASFRTLMENSSILRYRYEQANIKEKGDKTSEDDSIIDLEYVRSYNTLRAISNGSFNNKFIGFNPVLGKVSEKNFDYKDYSNSSTDNYYEDTYITPTPPAMKPSTYIRVVPSNSGMISSEYIKDKTDVSPDFFIQETFSLRTAELSLESYVVLKITVPGHSFLTVGSTLNLEIFTTQLSGGNRQLDTTYSGKYLITAARHIIQTSGVYQTVLEITKFIS